jgi:hypothetical protein
MRTILMTMKKLVRKNPRPNEPQPRSANADWLPPTLGVSDLSSPYFLAMADFESRWYFDRH